MFSKNHPLNFDLFPRLAVCRRMLSGDAGQWQEGTAPSQPRDHGVNNGFSVVHCV